MRSIDTQIMRRRRVRDDRHAVRRTSPGGSGSESRVRDAIGSGALLGAENGRVERALEADDAGALRMSAGADARERLKRTTKHRCRRERARRRERRAVFWMLRKNGGTLDTRYQSDLSEDVFGNSMDNTIRIQIQSHLFNPISPEHHSA